MIITVGDFISPAQNKLKHNMMVMSYVNRKKTV